MKPKQFVAISSVIYQDKMVLLNTSIGRTLRNDNGISFDEAIDFLFGLRFHERRKSNNVFVCYAFSRDNEFLFSSLSSDTKDRLFQSHHIRRKISQIEYDQDKIDTDLYHVLKDSQEYEQLDFESYANKLALQELLEVKHNDYQIQLQNGKRLLIRKQKKQLVIYDIFGFFRKPLREAVKQWLDTNNALLDNKCIDNEGDTFAIDKLQSLSDIECNAIASLATKLNKELQDHGITLSRFHGAGALSSWILQRGKAKTKDKKTNQYHNYRHRRQLSNELYNAMMQAYYGGRAEQFKIGTFNNGVNVYDINSAYAYAISQLPCMLSKPSAVREWNNQPFSLWYCEYDFSDLSCYFGLLPNRERHSNFTVFKSRGKGFFWQPEVSYILEHYPQCIEVKNGYTLTHKHAPFTDVVLEMYELRKFLQMINHPLEKVIKLGLSSIYGKFCQTNGKGYYYNRFYAGFITSVVRGKLLEATRGQEFSVISFLTDAIHTTRELDVAVSLEIGDYKQSKYKQAVYLDCGVYRLIDHNGKIKEATRGFRTFDFDNAFNEMLTKRVYKGMMDLFIGHNLHTLSPMMYDQYLAIKSEEKESSPLESSMRKFVNADIDLKKTFLDSQMFTKSNGLASGLYKENTFRDRDLGKDSLIAGRI